MAHGYEVRGVASIERVGTHAAAPGFGVCALGMGLGTSGLEYGVWCPGSGVQVMGVEALNDAQRKSFEPDHPHADEDGFVTYPKIDHSTEMALMIETSRVYEANLTALSLARQMYSRALEMGR